MKHRHNDDRLSTEDVANVTPLEHGMEPQNEPRRRDEPLPKAADYEGNYSRRVSERPRIDPGHRAAREAKSPERRESREERLRSEADDAQGSLFPEDQRQELQQRWNGIQTSFVDEPRQALEQADELVAETIMRLAESFAEARANLEAQWDRGEQVSTEELRLTLRRYRSFYGRLLSV